MINKSRIPTYDTPVKSGSSLTADTHTDPLGYRSLALQVTEYITRGLALDAYKIGAFDSDTMGDDPPIDPTRAYGYDMADASMAYDEVRAHLRDLYYAQSAQVRAHKRAQQYQQYHDIVDTLGKLKAANSPPASSPQQNGPAVAGNPAGAPAQ